ncbi:MAG TPA: hypothetical protein VN081_05025, partial [Dongiaceae bacterium]|nr:hypothetical protein [Dongiaceae bacterium]
SFLKKVVTVIIGILKWIWDTLSGGKKLRENTAIVAENAKVVAAANAEIKSKLAEAGALPDVEGDPDYLAAEASMKLVHDHWSLWHDDYLRIGRFSQFLDKFAEMFIAFFPMVEARVDLFRELITIKETPGDVGNEIELTARFLRATKSIQVGHFVQLFQSMAGDFNTMGKPLEEMSYTDVANNLVGISHHMMQTMDPHVSAMNAPQYTVYMRDAINDTKRDFNEGLLHHNNAEARVTNSLIDEYKKLLTVTPQQTYSEQMRLRYKNMIDSMTLEIRGLQQTVAIYGTLEVAVATMLKEYAASVFALNAYLEKKMAGMDPKGAYYKHAKEVLDRSRKELKRLR